MFLLREDLSEGQQHAYPRSVIVGAGSIDLRVIMGAKHDPLREVARQPANHIGSMAG